jgi:hypothetical protein
MKDLFRTRPCLTDYTRHDLFDHLRIAEVNWAGRMGEAQFLERIRHFQDAKHR